MAPLMRNLAPLMRNLALKDRQRAVMVKALHSGLQLEYSSGKEESWSRVPWSLLITDSFTRDVLSGLLSARDLRRLGVTMRTLIDAPRGAVPDAPVLYVMSATPDNVAWVLKDVQVKKLYRRVSVVFTGAASQQLLGAFAAQLTVPAPITRVVDCHARFVSLEQNMFSLGMKDSFACVNDIKSDDDLLKFVEPIVSGLLSVCVTLGVVPIIRAQRGGPAAAVAKALARAIRDNLCLFQGDTPKSVSAFRRPLLLLLDRNFDFNSMLHHTWTYQALVYDSFPVDLNTLTLPESGSRPEAKCELDKSSDSFWKEFASEPFPRVAEGVESALSAYRGEIESFNRRTGGDESSMQPSTSTMATAISSLPELAERKRTIDLHTNIATIALREIERRALDVFFELETQIITASNASSRASSSSASVYKASVLELLQGVEETSTGDRRGAGNPSDRLRLFLIFYLAFGAELTEEEMSRFRAALTSAGASTSAVDYVEKIRGYRHDLVRAPSRQEPTATGGSKRAILKGLMTNVVQRGYRGITSVAQNAKDLIVENKRSFGVARLLTLFMSDRARLAYGASANAVLDGYLMFDPKLQESCVDGEVDVDDPASTKARLMVFSDAILFTVGGGNYVEFEDCLAAIRQPSGEPECSNLVYGSTEILRSCDFLEQMAKGQELSAR